MWKPFCVILFIANSLKLSYALADNIELLQGSHFANGIFEKLLAAHNFTADQKAQDEFRPNLPLSALNQIKSVSSADANTFISPMQNRPRKVRIGSSNSTLERRATKCLGDVWREGDDPCTGRENEPGFVACYPPCMFTRDWFVNNAARKPASSQCLFYTSGLSETARQFVDRRNGEAQSQMKTIWHIWEKDPWMRYADRDIDNPMRCIIQDDVIPGARNSIRQRYFEGMSDAMAYMCGGRAVVMDRNIRRGRTGKLKQAGIWNRQEFPRLKMDAANKYQGRVVNIIDAIGEQNSRDTRVWWAKWWFRGGPDWPNEATRPFDLSLEGRDQLVQDESAPNVTKRDYVPWDTSIFDEGGRLSIDW